MKPQTLLHSIVATTLAVAFGWWIAGAPAAVAEAASSPSRDFAKEMSALSAPEDFNPYDPYEKLLQEWAAADPIAALQWTTKLDNPTSRLAMLAEVPQVAASPEAQAWVVALSSPRSRTEVGDALLKSLVKTDPEAAIRYAKLLRKPGENPDFILGPILTSLVKQDFHRAVEIHDELYEAFPDKALCALRPLEQKGLSFKWIDAWSKGTHWDQSIPTFQEIFGKWAEVDRDAAVKFFARHFHQSAPGYFSLDDILYGWSRHHREAARRWLEQSEFAKDEYYARSLYTGPIEAHPDGAAAWKPFPEPSDELKITIAGGDLVGPVLYDPTKRRITPMNRVSPESDTPSEWKARLDGGTRFILQVVDHHPSTIPSCMESRFIDTSTEGAEISVQLSNDVQRMTLTFAGDRAVPEYFKGNNEVVVARLRQLDWPANTSRWVTFMKKENRVYSAEISNVQEGNYVIEILERSPDDEISLPSEGSSVWTTNVRLPAKSPLTWKVE